LPASVILVIGFVVSEGVLALTRRSARTGSPGPDRGSLRLLWAVNFVSVTLAFLFASGRSGYRLPSEVPWQLIGTAIFVAGTILRWWAINHLGRFFSVDIAIAKDHRVIDDGPYRLVRHPSYTGLLMQFAGMGLALGNVPSLLVIFLPAFLTLLYRIRLEEAALLSGLGESYAEYARRTKRLLPWLV
jgi:protein-S-isoprenylcysteine O-methyltransferase